MEIDPVDSNKESLLENLCVFARDQLYGNILPFWCALAPDDRKGGFAGRITGEGVVLQDAPRGIILNARLLWTFSAVYSFNGNPLYLALARRAYDYMIAYFFDEIYGGCYWNLDSSGTPIEDKKQTYAQAFVIFAFSCYYKASREPGALEKAFALFELIEEKCHDQESDGYFEAFTRDWGVIADNRLSGKDLNEKKSMNTHLHLLEAYSSLLRVCRRDRLEMKLRELIGIFTGRIIDPSTFHQRLFFDEKWQCKSDLISYGHDIETSWLLYEAAMVTGDREIIRSAAGISAGMAEAAMEGINELGGLVHERKSGTACSGETEWWAQAEAVTGFLHAWRLTADMKFLLQARRVSDFITRYVADPKGGEWFYRLDKNGRPLAGYDKAGFWKCPYHNVRMCLEILKYHATSSC